MTQAAGEKAMVPELRFSEFSQGWVNEPMGLHHKIYDGTHQTPKYVKEGVPFYSVEHVTANNFSNTKYISEEVFEKESKRVVLNRGDVLMTRIGDIGTTRLIDWDVRASFYVSLALIKQSEEIDSSYLNSYMQTEYFQRELWKRIIHVAFPKKINLGEVSNCHYSAPSEIEEQQKIASFLTAVDDKLNQLRRKRDCLQTYKRGVMQKIFSQEIRFDVHGRTNAAVAGSAGAVTQDDGSAFPDWEKREFSSFVERVTESFTPQSNSMDFKCIELECLEQGTGKITFTLNSKDQKSIKTLFKNGDILYGKLRPYLKKFTQVDFDGVCSSEIWVLRGKDTKNSFVFSIVQTERFNEAMNIQSGSKMPRADWKLVSNFVFEIPSHNDEQQKISNFFSAIDQKIDAVEQQISKTETFKKGLLQKMFV